MRYTTITNNNNNYNNNILFLFLFFTNRYFNKLYLLCSCHINTSKSLTNMYNSEVFH